MKKVLIILVTYHLSLVTFSSPAVKLCKQTYRQTCSVIDNWKNASGGIGSHSYSGSYTGTWNLSVTISPSGSVSGESGCFINSSSASGSGQYCWCRVTDVNGNSCGGPWVYTFARGDWPCQEYCAHDCGYCARYGSLNSCSRAKLFANITENFPDATAVTCPANGMCENSDYKTVGDEDSCGNGWAETSVPALTISGDYSDAAGTFTYDACAK